MVVHGEEATEARVTSLTEPRGSTAKQMGIRVRSRMERRERE